MKRAARSAAPAVSALRLLTCAAFVLLIALAPTRVARGQQPWSTPDASNNINNTNTGSVGVGTTAPNKSAVSRAVTVNGSIDAIYELSVGDVRKGTLYHDGTNLSMTNNANGALTFGTNNTERIRVTSAGNFGIGTISPGETLTVGGRGVFGNINAHTLLYSSFDTQGNYTLEVGNGTAHSAITPFPVFTLSNNTTATDNATGIIGQINFANRQIADGSEKRMAGILSWVDGAINSGTLQFYTTSAGAYSERMRITSGGNVGIGMTGPNEKLQVQGAIRLDASAGSQPYTLLAQAPTGFGGSVLANNSDSAGKYITTASAVAANLVSGVFTINTASSGTAGNTISWNERLRVDNSGNVGIGTATPQKALDVHGDINVTGNINAKYQDMAEWVEAREHFAAGTVVVLDAEASNRVTTSTLAYDTKVAGVVSQTPGIVLGEAGENKVKVATTGRVRVKVDATKAPIKIGDLLVTSDVAGVAMKSIPVDLGGTPIHRPGTIIGKALEPLEKGTGEILVLLSLQ